MSISIPPTPFSVVIHAHQRLGRRPRSTFNVRMCWLHVRCTCRYSLHTYCYGLHAYLMLTIAKLLLSPCLCCHEKKEEINKKNMTGSLHCWPRNAFSSPENWSTILSVPGLSQTDRYSCVFVVVYFLAYNINITLIYVRVRTRQISAKRMAKMHACIEEKKKIILSRITEKTIPFSCCCRLVNIFRSIHPLANRFLFFVRFSCSRFRFFLWPSFLFFFCYIIFMWICVCALNWPVPNFCITKHPSATSEINPLPDTSKFMS